MILEDDRRDHAAVSLEEADLRDATEALHKKEIKLAIFTVVAAGLIVWLLFEAPQWVAGAIVPAIVAVKLAGREYDALSSRKKELKTRAKRLAIGDTAEEPLNTEVAGGGRGGR